MIRFSEAENILVTVKASHIEPFRLETSRKDLKQMVLLQFPCTFLGSDFSGVIEKVRKLCVLLPASIFKKSSLQDNRIYGHAGGVEEALEHLQEWLWQKQIL